MNTFLTGLLVFACSFPVKAANQATSDHKIQAEANLANSLAANPTSDSDFYALSTEITAALEAKSGGDPQKMQDLIQSYKRDPSAFFATLTPQQQAKIRAIAQRIEAASAEKGAPPKPGTNTVPASQSKPQEVAVKKSPPPILPPNFIWPVPVIPQNAKAQETPRPNIVNAPGKSPAKR